MALGESESGYREEGAGGRYQTRDSTTKIQVLVADDENRLSWIEVQRPRKTPARVAAYRDVFERGNRLPPPGYNSRAWFAPRGRCVILYVIMRIHRT